MASRSRRSRRRPGERDAMVNAPARVSTLRRKAGTATVFADAGIR